MEKYHILLTYVKASATYSCSCISIGVYAAPARQKQKGVIGSTFVYL